MTGVKTLRIGLPDAYIEHGSQNVLRQKYGLDADGIYAKIRDFVMQSRLKAVTPVAVLKTMDA
jgi:1-deoxy-D-xylulose-5-phosphate synthase